MSLDALPAQFLERFAINAALLLVLLRFVYHRVSPDRDSLFGFFLFGHGVYLVSALMHDVEISMGFAFGLFAVLSMLRYRTESISIRDMTYLFIVIVLSLTCAVGPLGLASLSAVGAALVGIVALSETALLAPRTVVRTVVYDEVANVRPERRNELVRDLQARLGVPVARVEVGDVDFLRDSAVLRVTVAKAGEARDEKVENEAVDDGIGRPGRSRRRPGASG